MTAKTHVLVVDDEAAILRFLKPALEANDYEMTSVGTVVEALNGSRPNPLTSFCLISAFPTATART
jgi:DNA-binding NtrC family response regulator